jgi:hypothetical protein
MRMLTSYSSICEKAVYQSENLRRACLLAGSFPFGSGVAAKLRQSMMVYRHAHRNRGVHIDA